MMYISGVQYLNLKYFVFWAIPKKYDEICERTFPENWMFCVLDNNIWELIMFWSVADNSVLSQCNIATKK
jgi:hypothetical protein